MLKGAVVGGPSIVFTRHHEAGKTYIRPHEVPNPIMYRNVLGFNANAVYLNTMLGDMPCGKETVTHYIDPVEAVPGFLRALEHVVWVCGVELPPFFFHNVRDGP